MRVIYVIFSVDVNGVYLNNFYIEIDEEHLEGLKKNLMQYNMRNTNVVYIK